uniref:PIG-l superfamily n=1 Tax=Borely moumouvirus TaxID=2712067 RepID=A0A6G6AC67_9VIRU
MSSKEKLYIIIVVIILFIYYFFIFRNLYSSDYIVKGNTNIDADKLMIVAHPDDELIFGSRFILEEPGWKIVCVTNATLKSNNYISFNKTNYRKEEFINVATELKCQYEMWDYEDANFNWNWNEEKLLKQLKTLLSEKQYKLILTHNLQGEYGHAQHKKISQLIHKLKPNNLYVFDLDTNYENPYTKKINELINLYSSQDEVIKKRYKYILHQSKKKVNFNAVMQ